MHFSYPRPDLDLDLLPTCFEQGHADPGTGKEVPPRESRTTQRKKGRPLWRNCRRDGTMSRFSAQYSIISSPREASGSASGGLMTIFGAGSLASLASGITWTGRQLSLALCATAIIALNTIAGACLPSLYN
jgi:hypothetical protein